MTQNQKKLLNNADQKLRRARKEINMAIEEDKNPTKLRRQETAGSDERMEVQESEQT